MTSMLHKLGICPFCTKNTLEIGVCSVCDIDSIELNDDGATETKALGARGLYGNELAVSYSMLYL